MYSNRHETDDTAGGQPMQISINPEETERTAEEWQELFDEYMMPPAQPSVAS